MRLALYGVLVAGVLWLAGCGSGESKEGGFSCESVAVDKSALPPLPPSQSFAGNPYYAQQWAIHYDERFYRQNGIDPDASVHMDGGHNFIGRGVKVAVIDDGLDVGHEDLAGAVVATYDVASATGDVHPCCAYENHGTMVTGVIAARNNGRGIVGVAPGSSVYFIRLPFDGPVFVSDIVAAFDRAGAWGVDVINCSWGSGDVDDAVRVAIANLARYGRGGRGTVIVFAAGNEGADIGRDESSLPDVIAVGATNRFNTRAFYSNFGSALDLMAPGGESIGIATLDQMGSAGLSTTYARNYLLYNDPNAFGGTSASAPIVTGVVADLLEANPSLSREEVYDVLRCSADKIGGVSYDKNGFNPYYGYGKINFNRALAKVR